MTRDHGSGSKQHDGRCKDPGAEREVEQEPIDEHWCDSDGGRAGLDPEYRDRPQAERKDRGQEEEHDAEDMHRAVPRVPVIFDVVGKLPPKI